MEHALALARQGVGLASPNPTVGCVIVNDGQIVGEGFHQYDWRDHAEIVALKSAKERARGSTLYVTLEPCSRTGRTGPCTEAIISSGVQRVVAAIEDPNPLNASRGLERLGLAGIEVVKDVGEDEARRLNEPFACWIRTKKPFVTLKSALTLDGQLALPRSGKKRARGIGKRDGHEWITSEESRLEVHRMRHASDALLTGIGTILADDPLLTARGAFRNRPLARVILDRRLRTPPTARVLSTVSAGPVIIVTSAAAAGRDTLRRQLEERGAEIEIQREPTFAAALERVAARGIGSLLVEGGAAVHAAAWDEGLVDLVRIYVTPHTAGTGGPGLLEGRRFSTGALFDRRVVPLGPDVMIEGYVHRPR